MLNRNKEETYRLGVVQFVWELQFEEKHLHSLRKFGNR